MRATRLDTCVYSIPLRRELSDAIHRVTAFETVVVRLYTDEDVEGVGWTYTLGSGGNSLKTLIDEVLAPIVLGEEIDNVERVWSLMWRGVHFLGSAGFTTHAISAVDIAIWDALAKRHQTPLFRYIGGYRNSAPCYGSGVNLHFSIQDLVEEMVRFVESGMRAVKMKVGKPTLREDLERVREVRKAIGPDVLLMVDANQKWTVAEAHIRAKALADLDVFWLEEPLIADDHYGYGQLARLSPVPLAAGETHYTRYQFQDLFARGAIRFVQADVCRVGGITEWLKIAKMAEAHNLPMCPHFVDELHVHLVCAVPNGYFVEYLHDASLTSSDLLIDPVRPVEGHMSPSERPGHGVEFNWKAMKRFQTA